MRAGVAEGGLISQFPFSLCQRHPLTLAPRRFSPLHGHHSHVPQADAARQLPGVIPRLSTVVEWRIANNVSKSTAIIFASGGRRFIQPRPVTLFREPSNWSKQLVIWGDLDTRLTWSPHIDQVRKKTAQRIGMLGPLLNGKSDLSVRNGVRYKQLIRPMMDYACPAWRSAARTHVRRLQVLQSKCFRLDTGAPWYVSNRQIHEDLGVPLFANHSRALTASFDSRLADVGNPLVRQIGRYLS
jgi:hypothetical protein